MGIRTPLRQWGTLCTRFRISYTQETRSAVLEDELIGLSKMTRTNLFPYT